MLKSSCLRSGEIRVDDGMQKGHPMPPGSNFADMTEDEVVGLLARAQRIDLVRGYLRQIAKPSEPSLPWP
jgi:hypothetical protein